VFLKSIVGTSCFKAQSSCFVGVVEVVFCFLDQLLSTFRADLGLIFRWSVEFNFGFFLIFSGLIFSIGAFGIAFNRKNVLLLMASVEIMFLGINLVFVSGYVFLNLEVGLIYALVNLSISAAEAAIGFGLLMSSFRNCPNISFSRFNRLRG
jgi:NADH:ubiquinone oxidoreductase subunit K